MRIALVHDYLAQYGGAERVLQCFHEIWPEAPIYTAVYDPSEFGGVFSKADIRTSSLQRVFGTKRAHKLALPFYATAFESFDFAEYDVVLSSSTGFAKGIITQPETCHICYLHTPSRIAWRFHEYMGEKSGALTKLLVKPLLPSLRSWDLMSSSRVDSYIANSFNTAKRIQKFYGRSSQVIHPPVDLARFSAASCPDSDYYLIVSRLISYKRIDIAVEACTRLRKRLKIVGAGPDGKGLEKFAGDTVEFLGRVGDGQVNDLMQRCKALIFPGEEDFGITPLEAMANGKPVIAYGKGGALETVKEGLNGLFFADQTPRSLMNAIIEFECSSGWDPVAIRESSLPFRTEVFKEKIKSAVDDCRDRYVRQYEEIKPLLTRSEFAAAHMLK